MSWPQRHPSPDQIAKTVRQKLVLSARLTDLIHHRRPRRAALATGGGSGGEWWRSGGAIVGHHPLHHGACLCSLAWAILPGELRWKDSYLSYCALTDFRDIVS